RRLHRPDRARQADPQDHARHARSRELAFRLPHQNRADDPRLRLRRSQRPQLPVAAQGPGLLDFLRHSHPQRRIVPHVPEVFRRRHHHLRRHSGHPRRKNQGDHRPRAEASGHGSYKEEEGMKIRTIALFAASALALWAQQSLTVSELTKFIYSSTHQLNGKLSDKEIADYLSKIKLKEKLDEAALERIHTDNPDIGPRTFGALRGLKDKSAGLPDPKPGENKVVYSVKTAAPSNEEQG